MALIHSPEFCLKRFNYTYKPLVPYFSTKTYVVDTQRNRLNEYIQTVSLENIYNFRLKNFVYI